MPAALLQLLHPIHTTRPPHMTLHPALAGLRDGKRGRALWLAAAKGDPVVLQRLLLVVNDAKDLNWRTPDVKATALHEAARYGHVAATLLLLQHGAEPNLYNIFGESPLHLAAKYGEDATYALLKKHNCDTHAKDGTGRTPHSIMINR